MATGKETQWQDSTFVVDGLQTGGYVTVTDAAAYTVLKANTGKVHAVPDLSQTCTITLPTPSAALAGLTYEFVYAGAAADASNFVITTASDTNYFVGGVIHLDTDAGAASDELVTVYADGNSNSKLTATTPGAGTRVRVITNGTLWLVEGTVASATAPAFADQ